MERMEEDQLVKRIIGPESRGVRLRGRPRMGWRDGVKKRAFDERAISVEQGRMIVCDRSEWKAVVNE